MKAITKISLCLSIVSVALILSLTVIASFFNLYVIMGSLSTSQILAILSVIGVLSFSIFLFCTRGFKSVFFVVPVAFLVVAEAILLTVTFLPVYRYTEHISEDALHTVVVEEKVSFTNTSLQVYKKASGIFYRYVYSIGSEADNKEHQFGNYTLSFEGNNIRLHAPAYSSKQILIRCPR